MGENINGNPQQFNIQPMQQMPQAQQPAPVQPEQPAAPQEPVASADQALDAAGRAQLQMTQIQTAPTDNVAADVNAAIKNPAILNQSEVLFDAALKAGYSYPEAASFATSEVR